MEEVSPRGVPVGSRGATSGVGSALVNKSDLVSPEQRRAIKAWMAQDHEGVPCFFTSAARDKGPSVGVRDVLAAWHSSSPKHFVRRELPPPSELFWDEKSITNLQARISVS